MGLLQLLSNRPDESTATVRSHQLTTFNPDTGHKTMAVARGERVTIGEVDGCGYIANIWLTFPGWFWQHWNTEAPVSPTILKSLILRIYWDGAKTPAVEAPVGDLCGVGLCEVSNFAAQYFGMSSGGFFIKYPMPFRKGFRIEVENLDAEIDTDVFMNVMYQLDDQLPEDAGYLHAQFNTARLQGPDASPIANCEGRGFYAGCTLAMQGEHKNYLSFLEAPEYMYIDDDWERPRIVGTGLEDYFLGGWYFREGSFTGPLHGVPVKDTLNAGVTMYRTHEHDAVHFERRFRMDFLNPWSPERLQPFAYSSAAYLYLDRPERCCGGLPSREDLLCWYRIRDCDHLSVP
jgi:hypothetical protein